MTFPLDETYYEKSTFTETKEGQKNSQREITMDFTVEEVKDQTSQC